MSIQDPRLFIYNASLSISIPTCQLPILEVNIWECPVETASGVSFLVQGALNVSIFVDSNDEDSQIHKRKLAQLSCSRFRT